MWSASAEIELLKSTDNDIIKNTHIPVSLSPLLSKRAEDTKTWNYTPPDSGTASYLLFITLQQTSCILALPIYPVAALCLKFLCSYNNIPIFCTVHGLYMHYFSLFALHVALVHKMTVLVHSMIWLDIMQNNYFQYF